MKTRPIPDTAMKRFWENNERFADLFNAVFFDGREVIKPELLTERNGDVSASVPIKKHYENVKKYQDVTKYYKGVELTILGIENQLCVNYAMPLRCRLYDDLDYLKECSALAGINKELRNLSNPDEFLSGLTKEDRLHMSFRIVIYYGEKPWDGPRKLSDMVIVPEAFQPFFQDYAMPLVVISDPENCKIPYKNESVKNLMTQLYLLYNKNWEEIRKQNVSLDNDTAQLLESLIGSKSFKMNFKKEEGETQMITAIAELEEQKWNEGNLAGREEGIELAYQIMQVIKKNPKWSDKKISKECNCSVKMVAKVRLGLEG